MAHKPFNRDGWRKCCSLDARSARNPAKKSIEQSES
jgi:hypothetical protein